MMQIKIVNQSLFLYIEMGKIVRNSVLMKSQSQQRTCIVSDVSTAALLTQGARTSGAPFTNMV